jgi:hypothetical protein
VKGNWFEVYHAPDVKQAAAYCGFARFDLRAPPFDLRAIERGRVRYYLRYHLPWEYALPGVETPDIIFDGPIAYAEWFAAEHCGMENAQAQAYRRQGEVWVVEVTDERQAVTIEVFIDNERFSANQIIGMHY